MKNGAEVMYAIFNGTGTNHTSWFKRERVLESSYTDLNSDNLPIYVGWWFQDQHQAYVHVHDK